MKSSTLYRIHTDEKILQSVKEIDFSEFNFKERYDIQEWVESNPEILGESLLIIAKELSYFDYTRERPDLVAIDKSGNIVIIELKRDDSGANLEWQAIKYASYLSKFKNKEIVLAFLNYLKKSEPEEDHNEETAEQYILDFIDEDNLSDLNQNQRLILVSHRFAREVTSAVNWLIDNYDMDIKCVQLIPYYDIDKETHYLQSNVILPIPGIDELIIKASGKKEVSRQSGFGPVRKSDEITSFFESVKESLKSKLDAELYPTKFSRWAGVGETFRYFHFWYDSGYYENWQFSYKLWLFNEKENKANRKGKFGIFYEFSKKHLLNKGVTEKSINDLIQLLKDQEKDGYKYKILNNGAWIEKFITNDNLSDNSVVEITKILAKLIRATKNKADIILQNGE